MNFIKIGDSWYLLSTTNTCEWTVGASDPGYTDDGIEWEYQAANEYSADDVDVLELNRIFSLPDERV
jgi:hypothetical protein